VGNWLFVYTDPGVPPLLCFFPRFCPAAIGGSGSVVSMVIGYVIADAAVMSRVKAREGGSGRQEASNTDSRSVHDRIVPSSSV
jgi:hypothetical protein